MMLRRTLCLRTNGPSSLIRNEGKLLVGMAIICWTPSRGLTNL